MIFDSALRKDLARSFVATLIVLLTTVITLMLIRTLGQASKGTFSPQDIMLVMGYTVLGYMPIVLSLSMFVAIIGTLARMYIDSEMVIWFASGKGLASMLRTLVRFAWPMVAAIAVLALVVWPWSQEQILDLRHQFQQRSDLDRVAPGEFQVASDGETVFFVDRETSTLESARQIFLATESPKVSAITTAQHASIEQREAQTWAVLENGQRVERMRRDPSTEKAAGYDFVSTRISEFARYEALVQRDVTSIAEATVRSTPSHMLLQEPTPAHMGELAWRLGLIFSAINYIIIALALTSANPRSSRMGHTITALLVYIVYFNLLSLGQSWVGRGKIDGWLFLLLLHGSIFVAASLWLLARNAQWSPASWFRRRVAA